MSTPLFENAFRMDTRRARGDFLKLAIILSLAMLIFVGSLTWAGAWASAFINEQFAATQDPIMLTIVTLIGLGTAIAVSVFIGVMLTCIAFQRCNDIGISRLWVLVFGSGYTFGFSDQDMLVIWDSSSAIPSWDIWVAAIITAPYVLFALYLLFKPGQAKSNAFGANPLSMSTAGASSKKAAPSKMAKRKAGKKASKKAGKKAAKKAAKKARS